MSFSLYDLISKVRSSYCRGVADGFSMSKGDLHYIVSDTCHELTAQWANVIRWPEQGELQHLAGHWQEKAGIHGVAGSIDGTCIRDTWTWGPDAGLVHLPERIPGHVSAGNTISVTTTTKIVFSPQMLNSIYIGCVEVEPCGCTHNPNCWFLCCSGRLFQRPGFESNIRQGNCQLWKYTVQCRYNKVQ